MGFFDGLTGGKQRDDYAAGQNAFRSNVAGYATQGRKKFGTQYGRAQSRYEPYGQMGQQGRADYDLYRKSIGLEGADGYNDAYGVFEADPFRDYRNQNVSNAIRDNFRRYNASGMANSGQNMLATGRIGAEYAQRDVDDFRNRLMGAGQYGTQIGYGADSALAGLDYGYGQDINNSYTNQGNAIAQSYLGQAYDDAATRGLGFNNLIRVARIPIDAMAAAAKAKTPAATGGNAGG